MIPCGENNYSRKRDWTNLQKKIRIGSIVTVTDIETMKIDIRAGVDIMMMMIAILEGADTATTKTDTATAETETETAVSVAHTAAPEVRLQLESADRVGRLQWIDAGTVHHLPPVIGHRQSIGVGLTAHHPHLDIDR